MIYDSILELIGDTPVVRVKNMDTGPCELLLKLENLNPGGSIKDRPALGMIEAAEKKGWLRPGDTIVEATAGNTGIGLAQVACLKGYRLIIVMPDKMSQEKIDHMQAFGAEVVLTRSDVARGDPEHYHEKAWRLAESLPNAYYINQFGNPDNTLTHERWTGPEIYRQMEGKLDAFVIGVGTGGTLSGAGHYLKQKISHLEIVLADPQGSMLVNYLSTGRIEPITPWLVEGIGEDYIPTICDMTLVDKAYEIADQEAFLTARQLLQTNGILAGSSSGTLLAAALRYCREQREPKRVLTLVCDTGNKYFSKLYNNAWMKEKGFMA